MPVDDRPALSGLIPESTVNEIVETMPVSSVALSSFRVKSGLSSKQNRVPIASVLPEADWVEELTEANTATTDHVKPPTVVGYGSAYINVEPVAAIVVVPDEVADDIRDGAGIDVWAQVRPQLAEALGAKIDQAVLFGIPGTTSPAAFPTGIAPRAHALGNVTSIAASTNLAEAINQGWIKVEEDGFDVDVQLAPRSIRGQLRGLKDSTGQPIYVSNFRDDGRVNLVYGEDLNYVTNGSWLPYTAGPPVNGASMIVGKGDHCWVGIRQDMTFKVLDQATINIGGTQVNLAQSDATALRVVMRVGFQVFAPPSREVGGTRYPFAVLRP